MEDLLFPVGDVLLYELDLSKSSRYPKHEFSHPGWRLAEKGKRAVIIPQDVYWQYVGMVHPLK